MTVKESVRTVLREKYATFKGRASRSEFGYFSLFINLCTFAIALLLLLLFALASKITNAHSTALYISLTFYFIFSFAMFVPFFAVLIRRIHDLNKSGWYLLTIYIPIYGFYVIYILFGKQGTVGENKFGADPLS